MDLDDVEFLNKLGHQPKIAMEDPLPPEQRKLCANGKLVPRLQDGNWQCEKCKNINYPRRTSCNRCALRRGAAGDAIVRGYVSRLKELGLRGVIDLTPVGIFPLPEFVAQNVAMSNAHTYTTSNRNYNATPPNPPAHTHTHTHGGDDGSSGLLQMLAAMGGGVGGVGGCVGALPGNLMSVPGSPGQEATAAIISSLLCSLGDAPSPTAHTDPHTLPSLSSLLDHPPTSSPPPEKSVSKPCLLQSASTVAPTPLSISQTAGGVCGGGEVGVSPSPPALPTPSPPSGVSVVGGYSRSLSINTVVGGGGGMGVHAQKSPTLQQNNAPYSSNTPPKVDTHTHTQSNNTPSPQALCQVLIDGFMANGSANPRQETATLLKQALVAMGEQPPSALPPLPGGNWMNCSSKEKPTVILHPEEFKNPSSFLKIYSDPTVNSASANKAGHLTAGVEGNWMCRGCENINFPRRHKCNKCQQIRDAEADISVKKFAMNVYYKLLKQYHTSIQGGDMCVEGGVCGMPERKDTLTQPLPSPSSHPLASPTLTHTAHTPLPPPPGFNSYPSSSPPLRPTPSPTTAPPLSSPPPLLTKNSSGGMWAGGGGSAGAPPPPSGSPPLPPTGVSRQYSTASTQSVNTHTHTFFSTAPTPPTSGGGSVAGGGSMPTQLSELVQAAGGVENFLSVLRDTVEKNKKDTPNTLLPPPQETQTHTSNASLSCVSGSIHMSNFDFLIPPSPVSPTPPSKIPVSVDLDFLMGGAGGVAGDTTVRARTEETRNATETQETPAGVVDFSLEKALAEE